MAMMQFQRLRQAAIRRMRARQNQQMYRRFTISTKSKYRHSVSRHPIQIHFRRNMKSRPQSQTFQSSQSFQQSRQLRYRPVQQIPMQAHTQSKQPYQSQQLGLIGNMGASGSRRQPISRWRQVQKKSPMGLVNHNQGNASTRQQLIRATQVQNFYQAKTLRGRRLRRGGRMATSLNTDSALWRSIGMRLTDKLRPNRDRIDLFNKELRAQITRNYILSNGGLQNIGTNLKKANDGTVQGELAFPSQMIPMFAISIRPTRFDNLRARLGPWERHLQHWQGTLGAVLDKNKMVKDGTCVPRLRRGEIGCYDAHYRLWKHMVDNNLAHAFILEDDADIQYGQYFVDRVNQMFAEIQKQNAQYDVIYLGHNINKPPRKKIGCLGVPAGVQGLFAYYLTLEGARKLLGNAIPMTQAVDDYVYVSRFMRQLTLEPRLCWVVPIEQSDTANIF